MVFNHPASLPPFMPDDQPIKKDGLTNEQWQKIKNQALRWKQENCLSIVHRNAIDRARNEINHLLPFIHKDDLDDAMQIFRSFAGRHPK